MYNKTIRDKLTPRALNASNVITKLTKNKSRLCILINPEKNDQFAHNVWGFAGLKIDGKPVPIEQDVLLDEILKKYDFVIHMKCLYNQSEYDISFKQITDSIVDLYFSIPHDEFTFHDFDQMLVPMWY